MKRYLPTIILCFLYNILVAQTITKEAETATLSGTTVVTTPAGYSGTGAVNMAATGSLTFTVNATTAGIYDLTIRVATPSGNKDQDMYVNGTYASALKFPANATYFDYSAGSVMLNSGNNTIEIRASWGWMVFDKITLVKALPNDYSITDELLIDPNADLKTRNVYSYLRSQYGKNIISGQTAYWNELLAISIKSPVVRAFDFQHYTVGYAYKWDNACGCQSFGWDDDGTTQSAINWYNSTGGKGIVTFQWHWHSPSGGTAGTNTFYTNSTTFDASQAVINGTPQNIAVLRDIDSIATQLKKLQAAGVPVLWRPLHEAGGAWFWWGAKGSATCLQLWDIVYNRLTNYHGIHNLIWVWSTPETSWYPGNTKVDIIGYDSYPPAYNYTPQKATFDQLYDIVQGKKMVTMSENGPIPNPADCITQDAMWLYFSSWSDMVTGQNTNQHIVDVYNHANVITLDEVNLNKQQSIPLQVGWNLISTNVQPTDSTIATLFSTLNVQEIKNADNFWYKGQNNSLNGLTKISSGNAYLVKMNAAGTLTITGPPVYKKQNIASMKTGWNMLGCVYQYNTPFTTDLNSSNTKTIKNFTGFWEPNGSTNSIVNFETGKGYYLKK